MQDPRDVSVVPALLERANYYGVLATTVRGMYLEGCFSFHRGFTLIRRFPDLVSHMKQRGDDF